MSPSILPDQMRPHGFLVIEPVQMSTAPVLRLLSEMIIHILFFLHAKHVICLRCVRLILGADLVSPRQTEESREDSFSTTRADRLLCRLIVIPHRSAGNRIMYLTIAIVWTKAYTCSRSPRPPGPFPSQSTSFLTEILVNSERPALT